MGKVQNAIVSVSVLSLLIALLASVAAIVVKVIWINDTLAETGLERVYTEVVVQPGDSLWSVAKKYNTTIAAILAANQIESESELPAEKLLLIPRRRA